MEILSVHHSQAHTVPLYHIDKAADGIRTPCEAQVSEECICDYHGLQHLHSTLFVLLYSTSMQVGESKQG